MMIYEFDEFELDVAAGELRQRGKAVAAEPQVFALLNLLIENSDRLISKDELIEKIWDGRIVSESALTSRVKSARQALGDDGKTQKYIKTVHGKGFRFIGVRTVKNRASATMAATALTRPESSPSFALAPSKPSIAVLPFRLVGVAGSLAPIADALPEEIISELSRLRWLFVIARGSAFRLRGNDADISLARSALGVGYLLSGSIEVVGAKIAVTVEIADTSSGGILWSERFSGSADAIHEIRLEIVRHVISALEIRIPLNEAERARLKTPENLDAWSNYHLGLQHYYRFNKTDNEAAASYFQRAIKLDPAFARAYAALSSAQFQSVFLKYGNDLETLKTEARRNGERSVEIDPLDPFSNFALGRVHWIENNVAGSSGWLDRAVSLSPNYAQGLYARAWADAIAGDGARGCESVDLAIALSPLDPFRYAMLGVRAFTHFINCEDAEAAQWANAAANTPGAHLLIAMIAAGINELAGDQAKAKRWAGVVKSRNAALSRKDFFAAFPFENRTAYARFDRALESLGF